MNLNDLSEGIIGAAIEVHKELGAGLLESSYEACLCHELSLRSIKFQRQLQLPVHYKGLTMDVGYRIDLLVEELIVVEIKAVKTVEPIHEAQLITYLKLGNWQLGLLINFNVQFLKDGVKRKVNNLTQ